MQPSSGAGQETIVAVATPPGRGGVSVVRLSGSSALPIALSIFRLRHPERPPVPHRVRYGHVVDDDGSMIDDALLTWFAAPHSYTGEDVVEIGTHGSPVVVQTVVQRLLERGAHLANPGEFTERAFLNRRLDLTQAEAVRDLIESSTVAQARLAAEQMSGSLQRELLPFKTNLIHLIAELEAGIDFAEDDLETLPAEQVVERIHEQRPPLERLLASFAHGRLLREGLRLAIIGRPNAGKSSLFNRLLERDRAIVTPVPGTTRDVVSERGNLGGVPVELLDTAGLRETDDLVERIGVERSREAMADADLLLHVVDASAPAETDDVRPPDGVPVILVWNKADLLPPADRIDLPAGTVWTSAVTGEGMEALRARILQEVSGEKAAAAGSHATLTNTRQRDSIRRALDAMERAEGAARSATPHEMVLLDLYEALQAMDDLTGQTTADDVLHRIFSTFCIGK